MCREWLSGNNINLNTFSNNQILEIDIQDVRSVHSDPQLILSCSKNNTGGKVYWNSNVLKMGNNQTFSLKLNYPLCLRLTLIDNIFSLYVDGILQNSVNVYTSSWLPFSGVQVNTADIIATGFRYKKF